MNEQEFFKAVGVRTAADLHKDNVPDDVLHGIIGKVTEAGELMDAVKRALVYNKPLDIANIKEEIGDDLFYTFMIMRYYGWNLEEVFTENDEKLELRYPRGFTVEDALARADKDEPLSEVGTVNKANSGEIESLEDQIERLASAIMGLDVGEPSRNEGAVDCAIRMLKDSYGAKSEREASKSEEAA